MQVPRCAHGSCARTGVPFALSSHSELALKRYLLAGRNAVSVMACGCSIGKDRGGGNLDHQEVLCAEEDVHGGGIRAGKLHPCPGWSHWHASGDMGREYLKIEPQTRVTRP